MNEKKSHETSWTFQNKLFSLWSPCNASFHSLFFFFLSLFSLCVFISFHLCLQFSSLSCWLFSVFFTVFVLSVFVAFPSIFLHVYLLSFYLVLSSCLFYSLITICGVWHIRCNMHISQKWNLPDCWAVCCQKITLLQLDAVPFCDHCVVLFGKLSMQWFGCL